jgi:UDP-N-acetylglucosamine transferase subunit ALG13
VPSTDDPFVFVTVGTDHHPFDRLIRWVDAWLLATGGAVRCLVQSGTSRVPEVAPSEGYLSHDGVLEHLREAAVVVTHGGTGTLMLCRHHGVVPIAVPRTRRLGEHVDDHQVRFVRRLAQNGDVLVAETEPTFRLLMDRGLADPGSLRIPPRDGRVAEVVQRFEALVGPLLERGRTSA